MVVNLSGDLPVFQYNDFEVFREDLELIEPGSFLGYIPVVWPNDTTITTPQIELQRIDAAIAELTRKRDKARNLAISYFASALLAFLGPKQMRLAVEYNGQINAMNTQRAQVEQLTSEELQTERESVQVKQLSQSSGLFSAITKAGYTITPTTKGNVPAFAVPAALISAAAFLVPMR